jgi:hypothetical protein
MTFRRLAAATAILSLLAFGGCGENEDCRLVCDKSEECGGAPADCMDSCDQDPPSDACLACYEEESCSDVGRCLSSCD